MELYRKVNEILENDTEDGRIEKKNRNTLRGFLATYVALLGIISFVIWFTLFHILINSPPNLKFWLAILAGEIFLLMVALAANIYAINLLKKS